MQLDISDRYTEWIVVCLIYVIKKVQSESFCCDSEKQLTLRLDIAYVSTTSILQKSGGLNFV